MSTLNIRGIPSPLVDHFWKQCEPFIKRALDHSHGEMTASDIREFAKAGLVQLWVVVEGSRIVATCTSEIIIYPRLKRCRILTLAGNNSTDWAEVANIFIEKWALEQGCVGMEAITRKGLIPKLQNIGYSYKQAIMVKELVHESEPRPTPIPERVPSQPEDQAA